MRPGKESSRPGARFIRAARDFLRACAENLRGEKTMASAASGEACSGGKPARSGAAVRGSCTFTGNGIRSFPPPLSATKTAAFWESASETDLSLPTLREMLTAKTNISQLCHGPLNLWHAKASRKRLAFVVDAPDRRSQEAGGIRISLATLHSFALAWQVRWDARISVPRMDKPR